MWEKGSIVIKDEGLLWGDSMGFWAGVTYWLLCILYDWIMSLRICWNHTVCWLLLADLVCYIFTVSVMINFLGAPCSLKELSFTSASLNRYRELPHTAQSTLLFLLLHLPYFKFWFLPEPDVPVLQWWFGKYELFILISMLLMSSQHSNGCFTSSCVCTCIDYTLCLFRMQISILNKQQLQRETPVDCWVSWSWCPDHILWFYAPFALIWLSYIVIEFFKAWKTNKLLQMWYH